MRGTIRTKPPKDSHPLYLSTRLPSPPLSLALVKPNGPISTFNITFLALEPHHINLLPHMILPKIHPI